MHAVRLPAFSEMHPHAEIAAESAEFASAAGLFWDMHDALFENQSRLSMFELTMVSAARRAVHAPCGKFPRKAGLCHRIDFLRVQPRRLIAAL
jgi:hypothetical protein